MLAETQEIARMANSTTIDISGNMEIPSSSSLGSSAGMIPGSAPGISSTLPSAAAGFANTYLARKIWSSLNSVKEVPFIQQTTSTGRQNMRSWFEFFNAKRFRKPTLGKLIQKDYYTGRLFKNVQYFHVNYICIFMILFMYCILTSPLLLLALFASCGAFYFAHMKNSIRKLAIAGHEITLFHQYLVIGFITLILFYYVGAGNAFMWVLGASLFFILLHAALFGIEDEGQEFAFQLEDV